MSLEAVICRYLYVNISDFGRKKWKMTQNLLETNSSLKLLTFQRSNVRELETIKYAFEIRFNSCIAYWI